MPTIYIESGLGKRASFNVKCVTNTALREFNIRCEINVPMIGMRYDKTRWFRRSEKVSDILTEIKKAFLGMVGSYLGNESDPDEMCLMHVAMIASKIVTDAQLSEAVSNELGCARKEYNDFING